MKIFIFVFCLFLFGCNSVLPSREVDLSDFIPKDEIESVVIVDFSFKELNYPDNCRWESLNRVVDGDTIVVGENERVRFIGIDTPESKDIRKKIQPFSLESTEKTKEILKKGSKVCLIFDSKSDKKDKYNRTLAYIFSESGEDVSKTLLETGMAKGYFYFPFSRKTEFEAYQQTAKDQFLGRWESKK